MPSPPRQLHAMSRQVPTKHATRMPSPPRQLHPSPGRSKSRHGRLALLLYSSCAAHGGYPRVNHSRVHLVHGRRPHFPANLPLVNKKLMELNIRGSSITIPGYGYTSPLVNEKLMELNTRGSSITIQGCGYTSMFHNGYTAEGMEISPLMVEGPSYGAGLALAILSHFGSRVTHAHLHVPYIPYELRR